MSSPTCPICGSMQASVHARARDVEYFTTDEEFTFLHCASCGVLFIAPMLEERLAEIYPSNYYSFFGTRKGLVRSVKEMLDRRWLQSVTAKIPGPALSVADVGGGTGWLLDLVRASDRRVTMTQVIDIDAGAQKIAESAGHRYFLGPIQQFETQERFDLILMLNLIEHVSDPRAVLGKAAALLSADGRLLIKTPNFDALDARIFRYRSWGGYHTPRHFVLFTKESFMRLAQSAGLEIAAFSYTQGAPFWSVSMLNELRTAGYVTVSKRRPAVYHPLMPSLQALFAAFDFMRRPFGNLSQMMFVLKRDAGAR
jgi:2-polyprenyl-3-methyl-5-hydroxy-6-metoxy-1,4-benzoquinol methylase